MVSAFLYCVTETHLLPLDVQTKQGDKAADLQQEIYKDSQASKERERPHGWHVGQSSCRERQGECKRNGSQETKYCTHFHKSAHRDQHCMN